MKRYPDRGLHGRVVDELGLRIMSGELIAGATVDTEDLAASYDVSRTVVREALKVLAGKGLIDARPRRGTYVRERTNWNLLDPDVLRWQFDSVTDVAILEKLHEVRVMVEPAAAELAAQRRTKDDVTALFAAVDGMAIEGASADAIAEADLRFHLGLIAATHNELVDQLSVIIGIGLSARDQYVHSHRVSINRGLDMHRQIAIAVEHRDPVAARALMTTLLEAAADDVRKLQRSGGKGPRSTSRS
ncbi:FadR/GntR family transcriptional regulator [uncultured Microbacterium sp.]|uniref:FadR/GntR family transcriptional regulator n=1 Tax=uncultured Microbacterium sp. TaxID=191216 RepID=UPI0035CCA4AD